MNLNLQQVYAIQSWAMGEPLVREVHLFGSRAKGTARSDSDADIALALNVPDEKVSAVFAMNGPFWQDDLKQRTGLSVGLAHLAGKISPKHTAAVADHGIKLYPLNL